MAKEKDFIDKSFLVLSGSHYSGCIGYCIEVIKSKQYGVMLRLELPDIIMWFNEKELKEF